MHKLKQINLNFKKDFFIKNLLINLNFILFDLK